MSNSESYGVGPAAKKLNIGATVNSVSVQENGKVTDQSGVVFDPEVDKIALQQEDGELSDQAEGKDQDEDAK